MMNAEIRRFKKSTIILIGGLLGSICILIFAIVQMIMIPKFELLEEERMKTYLETAQNAYLSKLNELERIAYDWAAWDDTYNYILTNNAEYINSNINLQTLANLKIDMILYLKASGEPLYTGQLDKNRTMILPPNNDIEYYFNLNEPFSKRENNLEVISGLIMLEDGPLLIVSYPISKTDDSNPGIGTLVMGKYVDADFIMDIASDLRLDFAMPILSEGERSEIMKIDSDRRTIENLTTINAVSKDVISGRLVQLDIHNEPWMALEVITDRDISKIGKDAVNKIIICIVIICVVFAASIFWYFDRKVIRQLELYEEIASQSEKELKMVNESLERVVIERTEKLHDVNQSLEEEVEVRKKIQRKVEDQYKSLHENTKKLVVVNESLENEIIKNKETTEKLIASENRFEAIVHALPDAIFKLNSQGYFLDLEVSNDDWLLMDRKEILGKCLTDILPTAIAKESLEKIQLTLTNRVMTIQEYELNIENENTFFEVRFIAASGEVVFAILRNVTELKEKQNYIEYLSYHDHLTNLYNRRFFEEELSRLDTWRNLPITIAMVDVNGLKLTNDIFGHFAGDELLKTVAMILKNNCRSDDILARIGGDEFVLILPKTSEDVAGDIIERIQHHIDEAEVHNMVVSISIGHDTKMTVEQSMREVMIMAENKMYSQKLEGSQDMRLRTVKKIIKLIQEKSQREKIHMERVSLICKKVGTELNLRADYIDDLELTGLVHDIGKISLKDELFMNEGILSDSEYEALKKHVESSYQILKSVDSYALIAEYALSHHERWDGTGYPRGLKGDEIPLVSRVIALADAYEAMTSGRPYRKKISVEEALINIEEHAGTQFDPELAGLFVEVFQTSNF